MVRHGMARHTNAMVQDEEGIAPSGRRNDGYCTSQSVSYCVMLTSDQIRSDEIIDGVSSCIVSNFMIFASGRPTDSYHLAYLVSRTESASMGPKEKKSEFYLAT